MEDQEEERQVPSLKLDEGRKVIVETKDIPLKVNGNDAFVTIQKLSSGKRNQINSECTKTKYINGQVNVDVNEREIQEKVLESAIVTAPFNTSLKDIKELPAEVTDYLFYEYRLFAEPTKKKSGK